MYGQKYILLGLFLNEPNNHLIPHYVSLCVQVLDHCDDLFQEDEFKFRNFLSSILHQV